MTGAGIFFAAVRRIRRRTGKNYGRADMNQNWDYNYDGGGATYSRPGIGAGYFFVLPYYASASILYRNPETDSVRLTCSHYTHYRWKNQADFRVLAAFSKLFRLN